ncbi:MAG: hypothetical protein ACYC1M_15220 [Armatimonadota bacterium]
MVTLLALLVMLMSVGSLCLADQAVPIAPPVGTLGSPAERLQYQTSFEEGYAGRNAGPINQTSVGIPGWPVMAIGNQMRLRYSEFDLRFRVVDGDTEKRLYILPNFKQTSPSGWLPGAITEFDYNGVHYRIGYIVAPGKLQPVDLFSVELENTSAKPQKGALRVLFDGAPSVKATDGVIDDRGKPLAVLVPEPEKIQQIWRDQGVVDPRATPAGAWWMAHRNGFYGTPIEYRLKMQKDQKTRVFLCFHGSPGIAGFAPSVWPVPNREIIAQVEGDSASQKLLIDKGSVLEFDGADTDGDGYMSIKVTATPESRQAAILNDIFLFPVGTKLDHQKLLANELTPQADRHIVCGSDLPTSVQTTKEGTDPTVAALQLDYAPELAPGEKKRYEIRLPAIDKPELQCYGNLYHPYDTGESWRDARDNRHPENKAPFGEDVPQGRDPADYAVFGPKDRKVWDAQLAQAKSISFDEGLRLTKDYWESRYAGVIRFDIPEQSITDTYMHQLAMLDLHTLKFSEHPYALVMGGPFFYWDFCYRDAAYELVALDQSGLHELTRLQMNAYTTAKSKMPHSRWTIGQWDDKDSDGLFMTRDGQFDAQGQTLWAMFEHAKLTGDTKWLKTNFSSFTRGADWVIRMIEREKKNLGDIKHIAYGLLPEGMMEGTPWHHALYFDAWAVLGLENVSDIAVSLRKTEDAKRYKAAAAELRAALKRAVQMSFVRKNEFVGAIPVCPEVPNDLSAWAMSALVHGDKVLSPHDPLVDAAWKYRESDASKLGGLMDWPYINTDWAIGYIDRGEPDRCTQLFYTYLSLASGTKDWGEWFALNKTFDEFTPPLVANESDSDMPHSESCSNYMYLFRSMMLRETGRDLSVAPASPRKWLAPGEHFGVQNAPSHFGKLNYTLSADADGTRLRAEVSFEGKIRPDRLLVNLRTPSTRGIKKVTVNGKSLQSFVGDCVVITKPGAKSLIEVELK